MQICIAILSAIIPVYEYSTSLPECRSVLKYSLLLLRGRRSIDSTDTCLQYLKCHSYIAHKHNFCSNWTQ